MSREPLLVCRTYLEEGMERFDERIVKPENIRVRIYPGAHNLGGTPGRGSGIPEYDRERTGGQGVEHLRLSINASPVVTANFPALAQWIANKEAAHGANIIIGIYKRFSAKPPRAVTGTPNLRKQCRVEGEMQVEE